MAFNSNTGKQSFTASAGQTIFPFNFKIYLNTDIKVYQTLAGQTGNDDTDILILATNYTVSIDGDDGGAVTLTSGAALNDTLVLVRDLPAVRNIEYQTSGDLLASTLNQDQDINMYISKDNDDILAKRAVTLPDTALSEIDVSLPDVLPEAYLRWDITGLKLENDTTTPTSVQDAADSAAAALASQNAAAVSESNASTSESNSNTSSLSSEDSNLDAASWANEAEDIPVKVYTNGVPADRVPTAFSAFHWDKKAEATVAISLDGLTDTNMSGKADLDLITWDLPSGKYIPLNRSVLGAKVAQPDIAAGTVIVEGVTLVLAITNYSADLTYAVVGINCTAVRNVGNIEVTAPTTATPSFTVQASHPDWTDSDSPITTRNLTTTLSTPSLNSPSDEVIDTNVIYTITVSNNSDKLIFDPQSADFIYVSQTGGTAGAKVGNTIEVTGITGTSVTITLQYTVASTYNNRALSQDTIGSYIDSAYSAIDSIIITLPLVDVLDIELGTGNGTSQNIPATIITTGVDLVWCKARSIVQYNNITNSIVGTGKHLDAGSDIAEVTASTLITALNADSIDLGNSSLVNQNLATYVYWMLSYPTDTPSNTAGSITSNTKNNDFSSIGTFLHTGATATIGHGNPITPELMFIFDRDNVLSNLIYSAANGATKGQFLDTTASVSTSTTYFNDTAPDATKFTLSTFNNAANHFFMTFASLAGVCDIDTYSGTGVTGNFRTCGFLPRYVLIRRINGAAETYIYDSVRGETKLIFGSSDIAELSSRTELTFEPTGFNLTNGDAGVNASGGEYFYLAIK